jgi:hypothetical protein
MNASLPIDLWGWQQGPEAERRAAPPASALIHQFSNNGIESFPYVIRDEFQAKQNMQAVEAVIQKLPSRLRKKMFALRLRVEWMVRTYGIEHVGLQTMTIRENITDRREFERRFKSISTNAFPKIFLEWLRVFERQQRGCWHVHNVVVTKEDIRTGTDVVTLNQLLKDKRDRKICKAVYYSGIKRLASPNLKAVWKEFRRLCGLGEFKSRRKKKGARFYKFDACHLLPIISTPQALAVYVSKYISKGFKHRRPEDKGMRLVGSTRNVSRVCNERFSWANGGGKLHRLKLGVLAGWFDIDSLDGFTEKFGSKWAYHLGPVLKDLDLPYYEDMKLAKLDGWDLQDKNGEPWPLPDLTLSAENVGRSHLRAYVRAKEILLHRCRLNRDRERPGVTRLLNKRAELAGTPPCLAFKSWIELSVKNN